MLMLLYMSRHQTQRCWCFYSKTFLTPVSTRLQILLSFLLLLLRNSISYLPLNAKCNPSNIVPRDQSVPGTAIKAVKISHPIST